jgi:hypothetical protein
MTLRSSWQICYTEIANYPVDARPVQRTEKKPQISPLRSPRFPVELGGAGKFHAAFLSESRTRGRVQRSEAGNLGTLRSR